MGKEGKTNDAFDEHFHAASSTLGILEQESPSVPMMEYFVSFLIEAASKH